MVRSIAINGFGRIGKSFLRALLDDKKAAQQLKVVAINVGPNLTENLGHLFKFDSVMGMYDGTVSFANNTLTIDELSIPVISCSSPAEANWKQYGVEWVVEASGCFTRRDQAAGHLQAGAKKVLITAPAHDEDATIVPGVNDAAYDAAKHEIISLGSCTTNCFAPLVKVIDEAFGLQQGTMTTIHSYTNSQVLLDVEHRDARRARAAALNIIPTKTGAARVITKVFPQLEGKLHAIALRVPTPNVSLVDFTVITEKPMTTETLNTAFKEQALGGLEGVIAYCEQPLVSSDFIGTPYAAIIDIELTYAAGTMGKVFAWYDNEYGYCCRMRDFLLGIQ